MTWLKHAVVGLVGAWLCGSGAHATDAPAPVKLTIEAQPLAAALNEWAKQTGYMVLVPTDGEARAMMAPKVDGSFTPEVALQMLLSRSGLSYEFVNPRTISIRVQNSASPVPAKTSARALEVEQMRLAQVSLGTPEEGGGQAKAAAGKAEEDDARGIPEILVTGARTLNMDIARNRDAPQPYTIFERAQIERAGSSSIEDFLKTRLTMNTQSTTLSQQTAGAFANNSQINLRGLGANQTLILVDGRRLPSFPSFGDAAQADLNGIPLAAIERIEVLPTTASGIYGGSATGGVVNVILRRDYTGAEIGVKYENTFSSDAATRRVDGAAGFTFAEGKSNLLVAGSYAKGEQPLYGERDFWQRGRNAILANTNNDYGALDPSSAYLVLGATTNIRSANGSNLVLDNGTALGSPITHVPYGYAGLSSGDGGAALVAQAGRYNIDSPQTAQYLGGANVQLGQEPELKSLSMTLRQQITPRLQGFVQGNFSESIARFTRDRTIGQTVISFLLPGSAAGNPFQQDVRVQVPSSSELATLVSTTQSRGAQGGLIYQLPRRWMVGVDYTWSRSTFDYVGASSGVTAAALTDVLSGALDVFRDNGRYPISLLPYLNATPPTPGEFDATLRDANLRFAGPLWALPGGSAQLTLLAEQRKELLGDGHSANITNGAYTVRVYPSRSQEIKSAYAELRLPWVSARNRLPGVEGLELQLAVRRDDYTTNGATASYVLPPSGIIPPGTVIRSSNNISSVDPTVALLYQPLEQLTLRASYGTGFLPPSVGQVVAAAPIPVTSGGIDALRGNTSLGSYIYTNGGNPALQPEDSKSYSAGVIWTPRMLAGLRLSVDYVKIKKTNNIAALSIETLINYFPERITRGANLSGDPAGWAGPVTEVDATLVNVAKAQLEAFDVQLDYGFDTAFGRFDWYALGTRQSYYKQQFVPNGPVVNNLAITSSNPLKLKGNAGLNWTHRGWSLGWTARYFDSYTAGSTSVVNQRQGNGGRVESQMYHDLFATYRFDAASTHRWLAATDITLGLKNIFDKEPPFDANNLVNGYYSTFGDPRLSSYWLSLKKNFN